MHNIRAWLFIGTRRDSMNPGLLAAKGITAMLQLAKQFEHPGIVTRFLPVVDAEPLSIELLRGGVDFVLDARAEGKSVLIACGGGFSRSMAFAVAALREEASPAATQVKPEGRATCELPNWQGP